MKNFRLTKIKLLFLFGFIIYFQKEILFTYKENKTDEITKNISGFALTLSAEKYLLSEGKNWESAGFFENIPASERNFNVWQAENAVKNSFYEKNKKDSLMISFRYRGIFESNNAGITFTPVLGPKKRNVIFDEKGVRSITSIDKNMRFITHKHEILFYHKTKWIKVKHNLRESKYLTAIYSTEDKVYLGTAVSGLYIAENYKENIIKNKKIEFKELKVGLPFKNHDSDIRMYEEIKAIHADKAGNLYVGCSIQGGLFVKPPDKNSFFKINLNMKNIKTLDIYNITSDIELNTLWVSSSYGLHIINTSKNDLSAESISYDNQEIIQWYNLLPDKPENLSIALINHKTNINLYAVYINKQKPLDKEKKDRIKKASNKKLFYSSALNLRKNKDKVFSLLKKNTFDGLVVDVKDDLGFITYNSKIPLIKEIGALKPLINLNEIVNFAKKYNKYIAVRIVVFKDPVLYKYKDFAILDKNTKKPWIGNKIERWIDPYNENLALDYYIPLIKELTEAGVDEIQLDYIRFPSDGAVSRCYFSHKKSDDIYRSEAIESFLYQIRQATYLPLSLDVYGYNALYRAPGIIGQDVEVYGEIADVICPMLYSSHFGDLYFADTPKDDRAYNLLRHSAVRSINISQNQFLLRPYLQAFPMKNNIWGYGKKYFLDQIKGYSEQNIYGFTFWGAFDHILKVKKALTN
ncbi:MAG: putative glycoside hydrolase [Spirochaetia bacterium]|nr:putative glycoside hydrolase [Spirochaetia bacterium]